MKKQKDSEITTIKIKKETKSRLDYFKEHQRESYEEVIKKMLHILSIVRNNPEAGNGILKNIELRIKRKVVYLQPEEEKQKRPAEKQENTRKDFIPIQKINLIKK